MDEKRIDQERIEQEDRLRKSFSHKGFSRRTFMGLSTVFGSSLLLTTMAGCNQKSETSTADTQEANKEAPKDRTYVDDADRSVTIPATVERVYCAIPTAQAAVVALTPEKLVGWVNEVSDAAKKYLPESTHNLPVLGGWMGQVQTANIEAIINAKPDLILYCYGTSTVNEDTSTYVNAADTIQNDTGIPVYVFKGNLNLISEKYRTLGEILGVSDRGEQLAAYAKQKLKAVGDAVAKVPGDKVVTCYYAEGKGGLATDPSGSMHTEVIDYCNVKNVAVVDGFMGAKGQGMIEVSMESVIKWNPQMILVSGTKPDNYELIKTSPSWQDIDAVKNGAVYQTPIIPFGWFDRPPNMTRIMGIQWFANLVYPDYYTANVRTDMKEYFKLFYNATITDDDVDTILAPNPKLA